MPDNRRLNRVFCVGGGRGNCFPQAAGVSFMMPPTPADESAAMKHSDSTATARERAARDFSAIVQAMKELHDIRVKKWRRSMSGCAWRVYHHDGRVVNWIESPVPKTP
ncbi:MAG TPA: hypothetical protein VLI90_01465, partial [Tepidisphaeraceae bacterium]|nr:hypothetical protein [Tepidisphaeraceae bacterium]